MLTQLSGLQAAELHGACRLACMLRAHVYSCSKAVACGLVSKQVKHTQEQLEYSPRHT